MLSAVELEIFKNLFASVAEEMGVTLGRTGYSSNIKERKDFSCAIFDAAGRMAAQAAHIPVHLGAMPLSVKAAIDLFEFAEGDAVLLNDPFRGGTHLPDITMVSPVFVDHEGGKVLFGFAANRAHHADVGGMSPGSMPMSTEIFQEGLVIPPLKIMEGGKLNQAALDLICRNVRTPRERKGDIAAQLAANRTGERRLQEIVAKYGLAKVQGYIDELIAYAERLTRAAISRIPDGEYAFEDYLDDDGQSDDPVPIRVKVSIRGDSLSCDFTGSAPEQLGGVNAVGSVTRSAVYYVVRCLADEDTPSNHGCFQPVECVIPQASVLDAGFPRAVAGGNVEASQRVVDVVFGALAKALPDIVPAAGQGTMNNIAVGGYDPFGKKNFAYYETMGGGMGARPGRDGLTGVHVHMSNTMNTPVEALEYTFPFRITEYSIRRGSGGEGKYRGGDGLRRDLLFLSPATVTVLSDRRRLAPYGLNGGSPGAKGENYHCHCGEEKELGSKATFRAAAGDILSIRSPGGGGWGKIAISDQPSAVRGDRS